MALSFDEDLARKTADDDKAKRKKNKRGKNSDEQSRRAVSDNKRSKQELVSKTREEVFAYAIHCVQVIFDRNLIFSMSLRLNFKQVNADFKAASLALDETEQRRMQARTLSAVFNTYFRVLKHTIQLDTIR